MNWFQRNQDVLGGVAGAIGGMRGARNPIAALLGAIGGGASGYSAGQKALGAQAAQEAQTAAIPQNVGIQQQQVQNERQRIQLEMASFLQKNYKPQTDQNNNIIGYISLIDGSVIRPEEMGSRMAQAFGRQYAPGSSPIGSNASFSMGDNTGPSSNFATWNNGRESTDGAKSATSSAAGQGQFIDETWLDLMRKHSSLAEGKTAAQILAMRQDPNIGPQLNVDMTNAYARDNAAVLSQAGLPANDRTLRIMHSFGPNDGVRVLQAAGQAPNTPMESVVSDKVLAANPAYKGKSVAQVANMLVGSQSTGQPAGQGASQQQPVSGDTLQAEVDRHQATLTQLGEKLRQAPTPEAHDAILTQIGVTQRQFEAAIANKQERDKGYIGLGINYKSTLASEAEQAQNLIQTANLMRGALDSGASVGPIASQVNYVTGVLKQLGIGNNFTNNLVDTFANPSAAATTNKLSNMMTGELSKIDPTGRLLSQWTALQQATPGTPIMDKAASKFLLDNVITPRATQAIERYNVIKDIPPEQYPLMQDRAVDYTRTHQWADASKLPGALQRQQQGQVPPIPAEFQGLPVVGYSFKDGWVLNDGTVLGFGRK